MGVRPLEEELMASEPELFAVGEEIEFNDVGKAAQVHLPVPCGRKAWTVQGFKLVESPPAPHPQLLDLGPGYAIGPVSGMFLTHKKNGAVR